MRSWRGAVIGCCGWLAGVYSESINWEKMVKQRSFLLSLLLIISTQSFAQSGISLVSDTPCLYEYRLWHQSFRRTESFPVPKEFTVEQCETASKVNELVEIQLAKERVNLDINAEAAKKLADDQVRLLKEKLRVEKEQESAKEEIEKAQRELIAKRPGVRIGMTAIEVVERSNWGKPERKARTTTSKGTFEQWIYGDGNYLYFQNGRLTTIQN
jgi:hypothetical protein